MLTTSKIIKIRKAKFEVGCSYKECNQFLVFKNYRLWDLMGSFMRFNPNNLESIIFYQPASHEIPTCVGSVEVLQKYKE